MNLYGSGVLGMFGDAWPMQRGEVPESFSIGAWKAAVPEKDPKPVDITCAHHPLKGQVFGCPELLSW